MNCPVDHFIPEDRCWVCVQVERDKIILALLEAAKKARAGILVGGRFNITGVIDVLDTAIAQAEERP